MSSNKSGSPVRLPKPPKLVSLEAPKTPKPATSKTRMLMLLVTPEQPLDSLPFSPGLKRTNLGSLKSPDYKLNSHGGQSPYMASSVLKTPRNSGYESDERETPHRKLLRTPQFLSPGRRLFNEDQSSNKRELLEISTQLKSKLSLALDKVKGGDKHGVAPVKLDFSDLSFTSTRDLPPKKLPLQPSSTLPPSSSLMRTNMNLQTLQQLPNVPVRHLRPHQALDTQLRQPPQFENGPVSIPSPDEESSAQNALLAAFSRLQSKNRRYSGTERQSSVVLQLRESPHVKLPPLNVALSTNQGGNVEREAIYSLMSLSSPQAVKKPHGTPSALHSRLHSGLQSHNDYSPVSSRSSSVAVQLPMISGLVGKVDNDETDVEDDITDDEMSS